MARLRFTTVAAVTLTAPDTKQTPEEITSQMKQTLQYTTEMNTHRMSPAYNYFHFTRKAAEHDELCGPTHHIVMLINAATLTSFGGGAGHTRMYTASITRGTQEVGKRNTAVK